MNFFSNPPISVDLFADRYSTHQRHPNADTSQTLVPSEPEPNTRCLCMTQVCARGMPLNPATNLLNLDKYVLSATKSHSLSNGFAT